MNRIEQIISEIEDYIEDCKTYPLSSSKIIVQKEELGARLVELRMAIPDEVRQCQKIVGNQNAILSEAKAKADSMVAEANRMTAHLVDEHEIMQRAYATANKLVEDAKQQAQGIVESATAEANSIKLSSIRYTDEMLKSLQTIINHTLTESQNRFEGLQSSLKSSYDIVSSNRQELAQGMAAQDKGPELPIQR
ncbi:MAG: vacuolar family H+-ATPase subunit H [Stomatobaculum sp.]